MNDDSTHCDGGEWKRREGCGEMMSLTCGNSKGMSSQDHLHDCYYLPSALLHGKMKLILKRDVTLVILSKSFILLVISMVV